MVPVVNVMTFRARVVGIALSQEQEKLIRENARDTMERRYTSERLL
jgi:hypothetical protein